ncbi:P-loop containing nucleoside triphosphate hydrolase protein [Penicillium malachiteum]|uniref:P-loop containing nucleoside triphosphate hydrolase protein n=1 Tax=Penicillium malachiteum TaxID=1324776 RepID=UPI00254946F9|nr:P-loop containing nucleoside triphosphate hydrolase protein [Penicillium malachiteum]KAJ5730155.1 P-loop containing nucleoside triphosphate hydrolase protein [Penicillium malachiteum]
MNSISFDGDNFGTQVGINNGSIHLPPSLERPETPPPPLSTVPFRRDPDFIDRGSLLDQIQEKASTQGARIALVGLGGVGKSQLAIEYCHRVRDQSPNTWVLWFHASNATRFEQSCREIADRARIPGRQDPKANIFKLVHYWLNDAKTGKWVLVLDNLDDDEFLHTMSSTQSSLVNDHSFVSERPIWSYFCQNSTGCVVITSRSRQVALRTVEDYDIIPVEPMNEPHAISLFEKKVGTQSDLSSIIQLATALEFMPLAIVQAAAFIKQRAPRDSVAQYLERFQKSDNQKINLLDYEGGQLRRDREAKNAILVTWQISFEDIQERRPSAAGLLSLMSFFDRQGIPNILLQEDQATKEKNKESGRSDASDTEDEINAYSDIDKLENDILLLRDYSLISVTSDPANFEMHRLVQLGMQKWLQAQDRLEHWKEVFIRRLDRHYPEGSLAYSLGGEWKKAEDLQLQVMETRKEMLGPEHPDTLTSMANLASTYRNQGRWKEAEDLQLQVMETRKEVLGPEHPSALTSMGDLASTYQNQGRWKEAEDLQLQVMETSKEILGLEHLFTLTSMANLASIYRNQGRWKEAEDLEVQVMEISKEILGLEHPDTLTSMGNLASTYWNQGRWKEAEDLQLQVMETCKEILGLEHPDTLTSTANLASTYQNQGRWKEAGDLEVQVMETCKKVLGPEHPDTLTIMANLASTYRNQGRWKEAEDLQLQVMETRKEMLGPEHPNTLTSIANLALTYRNQGRWKEAEDLQLQVMETRKEVLRPEHPSTLTSIANLALTYQNQGRWKEAEDLQLQVMETSKEILGLEHPSTLTSMANLASTYWNQGRWKEAEDLEVQVMETRKEMLGPEHPDTLTSMVNLAFTLRSLSENETALEMMAKYAESSSQILGPNHPYTLSSMSTWKEWQSSDETSPFESAESQIITSLEEKTEATTRASYIGGVSQRQILLSLLTLALGFVYVLTKG